MPIAGAASILDDDLLGRPQTSQFSMPLKQTVLSLASKVFSTKKKTKEYQSVPSTESLDEMEETMRL